MSSYRSYYDGYGSRRYSSSTASGVGAGASSSSASSYRPPPVSYRSPYTSGARERSTSRDKSATAALIDKYSTKESGSSSTATAPASERLSLRDKYNAYGTYPGRDAATSRTSSAYGAKTQQQADDEEEEREREREATAGYRSLARRAGAKERDLSPDLPADKLYGSNDKLYGSNDKLYGSTSSLSSYSRLYGRGSTYSRSNSRDAGDSGSSAASTPATTPVQIPTSLRFGSSTRYGTSVRSPASEKPPTVFGLSSSGSASAADRYSRYSRSYSTEDKKPASTLTSPTSPSAPELPKVKPKDDKDVKEESASEDSSTDEDETASEAKPAKIFITVVTRGTSPTPPSTSPYLRSRRADLARVLEKTVSKPTTRPETADKEVQSDRGDDTARHSRYGGTSRASPYLSAYLDRYGGSYSSPVSRYGSYTSRYSTRSDREPSVSSSKAEPEPTKPEPPKTEPPKTENSKPEPPKTLAIKPEVPKTEARKVTSTSNSSPLPSKELNKSTNKFPGTKAAAEQPTKETSKPTDELPKLPKVPSSSKIDVTAKKDSSVNKSSSLAKSDSTKNVTANKSSPLSRTDSSKNVADSPIVKSPTVSRSPSGKSVAGVPLPDSVKSAPESPASKSPAISRSESIKNVPGSPSTKSPSVSRSDSIKNVPESPTSKSAPGSRAESVKSPPESPATKSPSVSQSESIKNVADSPSSKSPAVSRSESIKNMSESPSTKSPVVSRSNSFNKTVTGKPPIGKSDSTASADAASTSLKTKSPSSSSLSEAPVTKTPPLSPSASKTKTDVTAIGDAAKLPPPVPKPDGLKTSSSLHALAGKNCVINKDFRKSPLNAGDAEAEAARAKGLRSAGGSSLSSSDAEATAGDGSAVKATAAAEKSAAALRLSKSLSKLAAGAGASPNLLEVPKPKEPSSPRRQSPARTKSQRDLKKALAAAHGRSPSRSPRRSASHSSSDSDASDSSSDSTSDTSSSETSSSETSSSEDSEEAPSSARLSPRRRPRRSPDQRAAHALGSARSSGEDLSLTADKPPRPPGAPKAAAAKQEEAKSFLMRALAPVASLFGRRAGADEPATDEPAAAAASARPSDKESSEGDKPRKRRIRRIESGEVPWWLDDNAEAPEGLARLQSSKSIARLAEAAAEMRKSTDSVPDRLPRTASGQSLRSSDKEDSAGGGSGKATPPGVARLHGNKSIAKLAEVAAELQRTDSRSKFRIRKVESGERAWWMDSNANIPEGIQRILSNSSIAAGAASATSSDGEKKNCIQKVRSSRSVAKMAEEGGDDRPCLYRIRHVASGEKAWWLSSCGDIPEGIVRLQTSSSESSDSEADAKDAKSTKSKSKDKDKDGQVPKFPLVLPEARRGSTQSRKGSVSGSGRQSPYDNVDQQQEQETNDKKMVQKKPRPKNLPLFIGSHTNIDDILGSAATTVEPAMGVARLKKKLQGGQVSDDDLGDSDCEEVAATQVRVHDSTAQTPELRRLRNGSVGAERRLSTDTSGMIKLDDAALQLYKDGDYGSYLDLEASLSEQQEELEGFQENRKNSIVLRTQLSVRVHTIIEKLLNSEGRELRRALFSLKQIFQEDKDLVHEFVQNDGLACLIKVGSEADQNYQNYILRALGQVMLYVDGMNGVMEHNQTVQWLYTLIASKYRLVVKTALKLLLVFVEYVETNCLLLIKAIQAVDKLHGLPAWSNIMKLLKDYDAADTELLIYATTLVNKTLNGVPDQDTYYDQVDALEEQGMEGTVQRYMSKQGTDLDLLRQLQIYEAVLHHEDGGEDRGSPLKQLDENIRKTLRNRKSLNESVAERRKSRRHSTGTSPLSQAAARGPAPAPAPGPAPAPAAGDDDETGSSSSRSSPGPGDAHLNGSAPKDGKDVGVTPALRRRRERAERQRSFIREQQETAATLKATLGNSEDSIEDENQKISQRISNGSIEGSNKFQPNRVPVRKDMTPLLNAVNSAESEGKVVDNNGILKKPWVLSLMYGKNADGMENVESEEMKGTNENGTDESSERKMLLQLKRENTVKDLTQKLTNQNILHSPVEEGNKINRIGDMTGLISKAKEGLAKSKSKADVTKSPTGENVPKLMEQKKSETELHWEELLSSLKRPLSLCDLDFTDLKSEDEVDVLSPTHISNGVPPPPPPVPMAPGMPRVGNGAPPPPPPVSRFGNGSAPPPPLFGVNLRNARNGTGNTTSSEISNKSPTSPTKKTKKTVKLFWKEVRDDPIILAKLQKTGMIWDELNPVNVDTQKLEHLFESRAKDLITKEKQQEMNKNKEIIVLDHKRSNAINIGMTKLPPPRSIKTAILKMDATIMNREGIEKLLTMLPTEEERAKIQEAQMANPDLPLGSAEQFLLTLASISELPARLKLWAFKLDYENSEKEIAEPLMDLKQGMETLKSNKTFRGILSTLLSIGIFLNGNEVKGFQIEYLAKVPEVKDTVHKHSLLHHLCHMVMEKFPDSSDLYSEIGAVTRASKVDFDELSSNILKMEQECKASWDHLKVIAKHDGSTMKVKISEFLADCAERIIVLGIVHRRVMNRFHKFLLWLGIPLHRVQDMKPNEFCRIVSEFSLEYRTTRERVLQQLEKKANHRERNKTRGKMITEVGKFRTKEDRADAELRQLLGSDISDAESIHGTLPWRRQRKDLGRTSLGPLITSESVNGHLTDGDDEILESLVKTATKAPTTRTTPRERKRTRHADRKSLRRTLRNGLSEEDKKHLAAYIKGY